MKKFKNDFTLNEVMEHWNKIAAEYDSSNRDHEETHDQRFIEAIKHIDVKRDMLILDVYCRTGDSIKFLTRNGNTVTIIGSELSEKLLKQAKKKYPKNPFVQASPQTLSFKDSSFDLVLSLESIEHVSDPLIFLSEIKRVLKSKGKLVLSHPPAIIDPIIQVVGALGLHHSEGPHKFLPSKIVKRMIDEVGLKLMKHKGTVLIPVGPKFLRNLGMKMENKIQNTPLKELCIRQFYLCEKS